MPLPQPSAITPLASPPQEPEPWVLIKQTPPCENRNENVCGEKYDDFWVRMGTFAGLGTPHMMSKGKNDDSYSVIEDKVKWRSGVLKKGQSPKQFGCLAPAQLLAGAASRSRPSLHAADGE